jgi:MFS family permease
MRTEANYSQFENRVVTYALPIASVGAGLTWSGLPFLLANETADLSNVFVLFMASIIAGALFTLIGGSVADHFPRKNFVIISLLGDTTLTSMLAYFGSAENIYLFYAVSFSSAIIGAMNGSALGLWIKDILSATSENLARGLARRGMWNIIGKAIGFSAGPILYAKLGFNALYVDAAFSLVPTIALLFVADLHRKSNERPGAIGGYSSLLVSNFWTRDRILILSLFGLTAAYTVPTTVVSYAILLSRFGSEVPNASSFWLFASVGSVISHFGLAQRIADKIDSGARLMLSQILMAFGFIGLWLAPSPSVFISFFMIFTLSNPIMTNSLETEVYEKCDDLFRGRFNALCQLADDLVGVAVLFVCQKYISVGLASYFYILVIPIMIIVFLLVQTNRSHLKSRLQNQPIEIGH